MESSMLKAIIWKDDRLQILDQTLLPKTTKYIDVNGVEDGWKIINKMQVRGAPAIAVAGCLSLAVELLRTDYNDKSKLSQDVKDKLSYLVSARPTAVNMKNAAVKLSKLADELENSQSQLADMKQKLIDEIVQMMDDDIRDNVAIGDNGAKEIISKLETKAVFLTHCNTGSLATAGYGTALGVVRSLFRDKQLEHVYCTETRPYNQGARLTAYELVCEKIPSTLICDDMVAAAMRDKGINVVVVGADRVALNGDTANKIGTYQIAVLAKHHGIPFYIAAPITTIDFNTKTGADIKIEERPRKEMTHINEFQIAADGIGVWNPSFDVTPAELITGIITDKGVFEPNQLSKLNN